MNWHKYWENNRELIIAIVCFSAVGFLAFWASLLTDETNSRTQSYSLAIGDESTGYKDGNGKLTFNLENNQGGTSTIYIYGLLLTNNINQAKYFISDLYSQDGSSVKANDVSIVPKVTSLGPISETPTKVDLTIQNSKKLGKFQGWFMLLIGEEIVSVPITASTDPLTNIALLWVTIGALISIGTWEFANYFDRTRTTELLNQNLDNESKMILTARKIKHDARLANAGQVAKFGFVNFFTILFGIATAYLALLSNPQVVGLQTISQFDILTLIGLGLGIGGLAGFLNKP
jgi:hypothetical protein